MVHIMGLAIMGGIMLAGALGVHFSSNEGHSADGLDNAPEDRPETHRRIPRFVVWASGLLVCLILGVTVFPALKGNASVESPEEAARLAFSALKEDSVEAFAPLVPDKSVVQWMLERAEGLDGLKKIVEERGIGEVVESRRDELNDDFEDARRDADGHIDWSSAEFDGVRLKPHDRARTGGVEVADIFFYVKSAGQRYEFHMNDCFKSNRGWISGRFKFRGRR